MGLRKFNFGGVSSSAYDMFITESSVYGAPARAVEMLEIPGRNGAYALDQGRFENVEIRYHILVSGSNATNFQTEMAKVRSWLCGKAGYQRLEDDYNPGEYRMAIFKSGLEADEQFWNGAEFDVVFECKPQRWLTSGETASSVASGGTLVNPTLFNASPLLEVKGYGGIDFNGYSIDIENVVFGEVQISNSALDVAELDIGSCNVGDEMYSKTVSGDSVYLGFYSYKRVAKGDATVAGTSSGSSHLTNTATHYIGTSWTRSTTIGPYSVSITKDGNRYSATFSITYSMHYDGDSTITFTATVSKSGTGLSYFDVETVCRIYPQYCDSTKSTLGDPTYIDCDIGECYMVQNDEIITLNNVVALGSDLPKLSSGTNTFTYDNTITELKVTPRWWQI